MSSFFPGLASGVPPFESLGVSTFFSYGIRAGLGLLILLNVGLRSEVSKWDLRSATRLQPLPLGIPPQQDGMSLTVFRIDSLIFAHTCHLAVFVLTYLPCPLTPGRKMASP